MNVFCDYHHGGLYKSLKLLFEDRLGWNLYRPIGMDWFYTGFWNIADPYPNPIDTASQYLEINNYGFDQYKYLNGTHYIKDGVYYVWDAAEEIHHKGITFDMFKEMQIDIVISSIQAHDTTYAKLIKDFKPQAKHIAQVGNAYQTAEVKNVMCSTAPYPIPEGKNVVFYHQEFPLNIFKYEKPMGGRNITNFVNLHPREDLYEQYKNALSDYKFKSFGSGCPDGTITGSHDMAAKMAESTFGWHIKPGGDGFGHVIHNWYACGRPVITNGSDYYDKLAGLLLEDEVTCIDLEQGTFEQNIEKIKKWSEPNNHIKLCQNAFNRFKQIVDFDNEEKEIRNFLDRLI